MKALKIAVAAAFVLFAVYYYVDNYVVSHPLMGSWKSDRELSMKEYYAVGISAEQEKSLLASLGQKTLRITKDQWMSSMRGKNDIYTYYIAAQNDGCYDVKKTQKPVESVCVRDDRLYLPGSVEGAHEVFVRR